MKELIFIESLTHRNNFQINFTLQFGPPPIIFEIKTKIKRIYLMPKNCVFHLLNRVLGTTRSITIVGSFTILTLGCMYVLIGIELKVGYTWKSPNVIVIYGSKWDRIGKRDINGCKLIWFGAICIMQYNPRVLLKCKSIVA